MGEMDIDKGRRQSYWPYGTNMKVQRTRDVGYSSTEIDISGETVNFSAGAAGTTGVTNVVKAPVYNSDGGIIGDTTDTSFSWVTGTVLTTEVAWRPDLTDTAQLALLSNGEYAIDYTTGRIRYKKATTGTSDTCNYKARYLHLEADIEIGAVELKDGTADTRASIKSDNAAAGTPNALFVAAKYEATLPTYTDGDAAVLHTTSDGRLHVHLDEDIEIGAVEIKDATSDTRAKVAAGNTMATTDNALAVADANVLAALTSTTYTDDSTGFTVATSKGFAVMGIATSDTIDANDVGAFRMTTSRNLGVDITTKDGAAWAANNAIFTRISDGTTGVVVETDGTKKALDVNITDGTNDFPTMDANTRAGFVKLTDGTTDTDVLPLTSGTAATGLAAVAGEIRDFDTAAGDDPTPAIGILGSKSGGATAIPAGDVVTNPIFTAVGDGTTGAVVETAGTKKALNVNVTDGTNDMPTMDAAARRGYVTHTDGTNTMPTMDVNTRPGFVKITDGAQEWSIDGSGYGQVDIAAQSLTALKVSATTAANAQGNPLYAAVSANTSANSSTNPIYTQATAVNAYAAGATQALTGGNDDGSLVLTGSTGRTLRKVYVAAPGAEGTLTITFYDGAAPTTPITGTLYFLGEPSDGFDLTGIAPASGTLGWRITGWTAQSATAYLTVQSTYTT